MTNPCKHFAPPKPTGSFGTATVGLFVCPWCEVDRVQAAHRQAVTTVRSFIERLRSFGRFYVVPITEQTEWALDKWLREHGYRFSIPILPGETLEQAMKRLPAEIAPSLRERIAALDPYTAHGATESGLAFADISTEHVQAFKDRVLDIIDELEER